MSNYPDPEWVKENELPQIGTQCPKCGSGTIEKNEFTSKKGKFFKGRKCNTCYYSWLISHFDQPQSTESTPNTSDTAERLDKMADYMKDRMDKIDEILDGMKENTEKLDSLKEALDRVIDSWSKL
jgi:ssDNA-binding Zn-finger/Zn-ribbon topoisomerase 1